MEDMERKRRLEELRRKRLATQQEEHQAPSVVVDDEAALISRQTAEKIAKAKEQAQKAAGNAWSVAKDLSAIASDRTRQAAEQAKLKAEALRRRRSVVVEASFVSPIQETTDYRAEVTPSHVEQQPHPAVENTAAVGSVRPTMPRLPVKLPPLKLPSRPFVLVGGLVVATTLLASAVWYFGFKSDATATQPPTQQTTWEVQAPTEPVGIQPEHVVKALPEEVASIDREPGKQVSADVPPPVMPSPERKGVPVAVPTPVAQRSDATSGNENAQPKKPKPQADKPVEKKKEQPVSKEESWQEKANNDIDAWAEQL